MAVRPPLDLTSVYAKLDRAEEHFKMVDGEIDVWLQGSHHSFVTDRNHDFTRYVFITRFSGPDPDFLRWTLIVGDCINNLRSSLDHLIYAIAKYETWDKPSAKIDSLAFVIADNEPDFGDWSRTRLKGLSVGVVAAIKNVQPFRRPHPDIPPLLSILRELVNADKHRLIRIAYAAVTKWELEFSGPEDNSIQRIFHVNPGEIENDTVTLALVSSKPEPNLTFHGGHLGLSVALWHGFRDGETNPTSDRSDYSALLKLLIGEVAFVISEVSKAVI